MKNDFQRLFRSIGDIMVETLRPITAKLVELEARKPEKGDPGGPGEQGVKGDPGIDGKHGVDGKDGQPGAKGDAGVDGKDGIDGKDGVDGLHGAKGDPGVDGKHGVDGKDAVDGLPGAKGDPGVDGRHGVDGKDGKDGLPGVKGDSGEPGAKGDPGIDGEDGEDGKDGVDGKDGKDGRDGVTGNDGKSVLVDDVLPVLDGAVAKWMLEVERRIMDTAQRAVDAMPKPRDGKDGIDGLNADDFQFSFDLDTRLFSATHKGRILFSKRIPYPKYIDVWSENFRQYEEGFVVTFGGHGWIAKRDTSSKPGTDDSWQLFVKKGRDGK